MPAVEHVAYLSTSGNDDTGTVDDQWKPFRSLEVAIARLGAEGGTVQVANGTYSFEEATAPEELQGDHYTAGASCVLVTTPVRIVGASGNPADVIFQRDRLLTNGRVFYINHADAVLKNVTVQNGYFKDGIRNGGNVLIGYAGGTVENCILKDGNAGNANNTNIGGGNIALMAGRCSRCLITGGKLSFYRPIGLNVMAAGSSTVENSLITKGADTSTHEAAHDEGAVALKDKAKLINCTVTENFANRFSGVNILSGNAKAINCLIYGNTVRYETDDRGVTTDSSANGVSMNRKYVANYINCGTDLDTSVYPQLNDSCFTVRSIDFTDAENSDWTPNVNSVTRDAGASYADTGATSDQDLAGNSRVQGAGVDVGCYELAPQFHVQASVDKVFNLIGVTGPTHFTATAGDADGEVVYTWNFGDGSATLTTTEATVEHTYTAVGSYSVQVTATCTSGTVIYVFSDPIVASQFDVTFSRSTDLSVSTRPITFTAQPSTADPVTYTWTFGDGTTVETSENEVQHTYAGGKYEVSVRADAGRNGVISYVFETELAVVDPDIYVKRSGSAPAFPFGTPATAAQGLDAVKDYLTDGVTVHVAPGTYQTRDWQLVLTNSVTVVGEGATANEVVFHNGFANFNNGTRNLYVNHAEARVSNVTLMGGFANYAVGGNLQLVNGVVSNCVLSTGGSNSSGGSGGAAYISGGLLTHCVITNAYLGNRGDGIVVRQTGGRVSNCLITHNRKSWSGSRNAFSLYSADGGVVDNCTIKDCWILKYNPNNKLQMNKSDTGFKVTGSAKAYNLVIANLHYDFVPGSADENPEDLIAAAYAENVQRWAGTSGNFVNCATDDVAPINGTCWVGTLAKDSLFTDYSEGDFTPGAAVKDKGAVIEGYSFPSVDLAGNARVTGRGIDLGCYEHVPTAGMKVILR